MAQDTRRFPPPWTVEQIPGGYKLMTQTAKLSLMSMDARRGLVPTQRTCSPWQRARRIASNIATLPNYLAANPERRKVRAYTRNGFDWTERYSGITKAAAKLECRSAIIDGEVVVQDERGVSDFEVLKSAIRCHPQRLIFCAFDLLQLNGNDLRDGPLLERRVKLKEIIPSCSAKSSPGMPPHSSKPVPITSLRALCPSLPRQNTGVDAARLGLRRNALPKAHS
jgi:hypothetical protein